MSLLASFKSRAAWRARAVIAFILSLAGCGDGRLDADAFAHHYGKTLTPPQEPLTVYHLGHSLVGRDMPVMLQQMAESDHVFYSQLGWGATLQSHFEPDIPVNGFAEENTHTQYRDVFDAIDSAELDAFVMTEMVEIRDAIRYFDSAKYVERFAARVHSASPSTRIYLYETWHEVNHPEGWRKRLAEDYDRHWLGEIQEPTQRALGESPTIYLIPAGQVLKALFQHIEKNGPIAELAKPEDLFARNSDGSLDPIHINAKGAYLVALVHFAVLYQRSPVGLAHDLIGADGEPADTPSAELAALMQEIVWKVVRNDFRTGLTAYNP